MTREEKLKAIKKPESFNSIEYVEVLSFFAYNLFCICRKLDNVDKHDYIDKWFGYTEVFSDYLPSFKIDYKKSAKINNLIDEYLKECIHTKDVYLKYTFHLAQIVTLGDYKVPSKCDSAS